MKLISKIFSKKGSDDRRNGKSQPGSPNPYHCTSTVSSPRTGTVTAAKVLRILGAESKDEENQIMRTMAETMEQPDSDISFEDDGFQDRQAYTTPNFDRRRLSDASYAPPRCSSDTDTFDPSSYESMSPTPSSRLSPASDPWSRSPQHSPRTYNTMANCIRESNGRAHPLPVPLRDRVGNSLKLTAPKPLPLPPQAENLTSAVSYRLDSHARSFERASPLPSPSSTVTTYRGLAPQSPRRSTPQHSPQRSPTRSLKIQKLKELGRGSFATVYEGFMDDGSFCAIKVIRDSTLIEDTTKEVALLSQLNHQNIVRYLGACIDESGSLCIFLELMKYSLKSILTKLGTGFEESTIRSYTRQILHGLAYLHEHGTIHRDIKCANILVDPQGQVKLADFGVAKQTPEASSLKGTPIFMAPEVMTPNPSKRSYGTAVDIWSLGCTVLEMASGQAPWSDLGFAFYFKLSRGEAPPIPDSLSPVAKDFVRSCLCFSPDDRPTARELLHHQFVIDAPSSVPSFSPLLSPRASPLHKHGVSRNLMQETHFHPIEGLRRNGNLNLIAREDSGISAVINRTRLEPQQMIFRAPHNAEREAELQGLVL